MVAARRNRKSPVTGNHLPSQATNIRGTPQKAILNQTIRLCLCLFLSLFAFLTPFSSQALLISVSAQSGGLANLNETVGVYQPLTGQGLIAMASFSSDYEDTNYTAIAHAAAYGTDGSSNGLFGVEPMAHAAAETKVKEGATQINLIGSAIGASSINVKHRVQAKETADLNVVNAITVIPLFLNYRLDTSIAGPLFAANSAANFSIQGPGINTGRNVSNGESAAGTLSFSASTAAGILDYNIGVTAGAGAHWGYTNDPDQPIAGGSSQAVADPFLFIDPDWAFLSLFEVLQESSINSGEWREVSRIWQLEPPTGDPDVPIPEPSTVLLFGCGLAGLFWYGRKWKSSD